MKDGVLVLEIRGSTVLGAAGLTIRTPGHVSGRGEKSVREHIEDHFDEGDIVVMISKDRFESLMEARRAEPEEEKGGLLGEHLVAMGAIDGDQLLEALGRQAGMEAIKLAPGDVDPAAAKLVDATTATMYGIMPVRINPDGALLVAMSNPMNLAMLDDIRFSANREIVGAVCAETELKAAIEAVYGGEQDSAGRILKEIEAEAGPAQGTPV
jgi:type IV pilus assembly protein PilB